MSKEGKIAGGEKGGSECFYSTLSCFKHAFVPKRETFCTFVSYVVVVLLNTAKIMVRVSFLSHVVVPSDNGDPFFSRFECGWYGLATIMGNVLIFCFVLRRFHNN